MAGRKRLRAIVAARKSLLGLQIAAVSYLAASSLQFAELFRFFSTYPETFERRSCLYCRLTVALDWLVPLENTTIERRFKWKHRSGEECPSEERSRLQRRQALRKSCPFLEASIFGFRLTYSSPLVCHCLSAFLCLSLFPFPPPPSLLYLSFYAPLYIHYVSMYLPIQGGLL